MAVDKSYARLGLFLVVAVVVVLASSVFFIQRLRSRPLLAVVTYTTDNVSGLDVSSPVRFRGVTIGQVSDIGLHPKGSIIEINFDIFLDRIRTLGGSVNRLKELADLGMFSTLRAQVIGNPVTGEAYLLLDLPKDPSPAIPLGFTPDRPYVPMMPSLRTQVQDRLPDLIERAEGTLRVFGEIVARLPASLDRSDRFFANVERSFHESDLPGLSTDSRKFFNVTSEQMGRLTSELEGVIGPGGKLDQLVEEARGALKEADVPGTTLATRNASQQTILAAEDFRRSLPAIRESLEQLREVAKMLEDQPESMVYGPRPAKGKGQ
jgi:paraquat-inducible protein B